MADRSPREGGIAARSFIGQRLGAYEIVALAGAGGMGEVYRARDSRIGRDVAVKVLPPAFSADGDRRQRFQREARAIGALNHPNICTIHDVGQANGVDFLVMEFLEGETLAARLVRGPLPLNEALARAIEIADALSTAHRQGIVHRDLKPGNVMLTTTGAKLLDFGLARIVIDEPEAEAFASVAATITAPLTGAGVVLGTIQYMAPEQIEGVAADQRTDVFAFGAVLYEMVTAKRAFTGATTASLMAAILRADAPSLAVLPVLAPRALDRLVRTCLAKDPDARFSTMHDVAVGLRGIAADVEEIARQTTTTVSVTRVARLPVWVTVTVLLVAIALAGYWLGSRARLRPIPVAQTFSEIVPPAGASSYAGLALSPDGRTLVVDVVNVLGGRHLWLRELGSLVGRRLEGTEGGENPFWSPDGRSIAFFADGTLKRVDLAGGAPVPICRVAGDGGGSRGGAWFDDGTIVFAPSEVAGLQRVLAGGSEPESFLTLDLARGEVGLRFPIVIGRRSLVYLAANADPNKSEIRRASLDAPGQSATVVRTMRSAAFADGWLFYDRDGPVVAQRLDERTGAVTGEPRPVAGTVLSGYIGQMNFAASGATLAWWTDRPALAMLEWVDRQGKSDPFPGDPDVIRTLALSPDDNSVAVVKETNGQQDIWVIDTRTGTSRRLTSDHAIKLRLIWSATGRLAYSAYGGGAGTMNIYYVDPAETSPRVPIAEDLTNLQPVGWIDRDQSFAWIRQPIADDSVLRMRSLEPRKEPVDLAKKTFGAFAALSPDGAGIAYTLRESGQSNLFVDRFPALNAPQLVARDVSGYPRWRQDGHEVFFRSRRMAHGRHHQVRGEPAYRTTD